MRRSSRSILVILILVASSGCGSRYNGPDEDTTSDKQTIAEGEKLFAVTPATPLECPAGGSVYSIYNDSNGNFLLDEDETVLNRQVVCNGTSGQDGFSTLFSLDRVSTGLVACASGSGLQISSGLDGDRSQILEPSEINQAQILCDGEDGSVGAAGPAGSAGVGMVFQVVPALLSDCAGGGSILLMALDGDSSGNFSATDPGQQSVTMCNGENAAVPAYTTVETITPCGNNVAYKEVLLRLQNGQVLASFSNDTGGTMTRLAFLPDGTFMNTDSSGCVFSLATSGDGATRSISWSNQVQMSWSMP